MKKREKKNISIIPISSSHEWQWADCWGASVGEEHPSNEKFIYFLYQREVIEVEKRKKRKCFVFVCAKTLSPVRLLHPSKYEKGKKNGEK